MLKLDWIDQSSTVCGGNLDNVSTTDINDCRCAGVVMIRMIKFTMVIGKNIIVMMVMLVRQVYVSGDLQLSSP